MKPIVSLIFANLIFIVSGTAQAAPPMPPEQFEVKNLIEKIYSYDPDTFEYGEFDRQLRPYTRKYPPNKQAKYHPIEQCKLLKTMFVDAMLPVTPPKNDCYFPPDTTHYRFPNVSDEDMSPATRETSAFTEKFTIAPPAVQGDHAKVAVFTKKARSLYFLTKTDKGWRVSNAMIHWVWPDLDDGMHNCYYKFVLPPSPEEKKEILPYCRR